MLRGNWFTFAACLLAGLSLATHTLAQDVTLTSRDGGVEVSGMLIGYDGEFYRVDTEFGILTLDGSGVDCSGPGCPDLGQFVASVAMAGSPVIAERLIPVLVAAFARDQGYALAQSVLPGDVTQFELLDGQAGRVTARFAVAATSDAAGFAEMVAGQADMTLSSREVLPEEVALASDAGLGQLDSPLQTRVLALDAVVPVASARNPLSSISLDALARIYSDGRGDWNDLGGIDAPIVPRIGPPDSMAWRAMLEQILLPEGGQMAAGVTAHGSQEELLAAIADDPFSLGLAPLSDVGRARVLDLAGGCGFEMSASSEALKSEDYPLTAPHFVYLRSGRMPRVAREFIRFARSPAAQVAILRAGFVDQGFSRTPLERQGRRLANAIEHAGSEVTLEDLKDLVGLMQGRGRLSVSFRFREGSSDLDAQSRSNVILLARALETGSLGARELHFVGFSDGMGAAVENRRLSRERAQTVRNAVLAAAPTFDESQLPIRVAGFGEALPMACDDTAWGRQINRRVEVWLR